MKNYKIKINNPDESKQVQALLFKLGYKWPLSKTDYVWINKPWLSTSPTGAIRWHDENGHSEFYRCELISLSKLKELAGVSVDKCREAFESKYRELRPDDKCTMMENGNYSGWIKQAHWWMWQSRQAEVDEHHKINVALNSETIKQREQIRHYMNQCVEKGKRITNATEQLNGFMRMIQEDLICDESLSNLLIVNLKGLEKALRGDNA